jgi:hypothetical protein
MAWQKSEGLPPVTEEAPVNITPKHDGDELIGLWPFVWTLFAFKFVTALIIWWFAAGSEGTYSILVGTHWFWMIIPILAMSGSVAYQIRVRRVRRKRARLQAAEWMVDELRSTR